VALVELGGRGRRSASPWLDPGPVPRGTDWIEAVNAPMFEAEIEAIRRCVERDRPFGGEAWVRQTAATLGLASSLEVLRNPRTTNRSQDRR
jgi:putative transposase